MSETTILTGIAVIFTAMAGLVTIFFGKSYWELLKGLVKSSQGQLERLQLEVVAMQVKIDDLDKALHVEIVENERLASLIDDYVAENERLREGIGQVSQDL